MRQSTHIAALAAILPLACPSLLGASAFLLWRYYGSRIQAAWSAWTRRRGRARQTYSVSIQRRQPQSPGDSETTDDSKNASLEQAGRPRPSIRHPHRWSQRSSFETARGASLELAELGHQAESKRLHSAASSELQNSSEATDASQEDQDAVLKQQMLGRQLLSELSDRLQSGTSPTGLGSATPTPTQ